MAWGALGLGTVAVLWVQCRVATAQLDIAGHQQLQEAGQLQPTLEVKKEKSFQVFDAVTERPVGNVTSSTVAQVPVLVEVSNLVDNETSGGEASSSRGEMVSYSTKVSVSMKQAPGPGEQLIDRASFYPPGQLYGPQHHYPAISEQLTPASLGSSVQPQQQQYQPQYHQLQQYTPAQSQQQYYLPPLYQHQQFPGVQYGPGPAYGYTSSYPSYLNLTSYPEYAQVQAPYLQSQVVPQEYPQYQLHPGYPLHQAPYHGLGHGYPGREYRAGLPYGELYPQEYLTTPLDPAPSPGHSLQQQGYGTKAKAEAKIEEEGVDSAEKRGLALGGIGGHIRPPLGPKLHGLGPVGPLGAVVKPPLLPPKLPLKPHFRHVPVPVPVHVPLVRTLHTNHLSNHEHVHRHTNTHAHKHEHKQEHAHKHEEEHAHVHRHTHHHDHHHNHKHRSEHEHREDHRHQHGHKHKHGHKHGHKEYHGHSDYVEGGYIVS